MRKFMYAERELGVSIELSINNKEAAALMMLAVDR